MAWWLHKMRMLVVVDEELGNLDVVMATICVPGLSYASHSIASHYIVFCDHVICCLFGLALTFTSVNS